MGMLALISAVVLSQADAGVVRTEAEQKEVDAALSMARPVIRDKMKAKYGAVIARLDACTKKVPGAAECWQLLAFTHASAGELQKAKASYERFLEVSELVSPPSVFDQQQYPWVDYPQIPK